jgi:hypothetical protein
MPIPRNGARFRASVLIAVLVVCGQALAEDFRPDAGPAPPFSLGLLTLPSASASPPAPSYSFRRRFRTAAGELALAELLPWVFDRYVENVDYARISWHTVSENWKAGFAFDTNEFEGNEALHPYQGSLFFEAGRSNGFTYWESGLFALTGSLIWEFCMENEQPSTNDVVNTSLGGMVRGEVQHRLATMILDNTASGGERFWRELGAGILNPVGFLTRLFNGELGRSFENPPDRLPDGFALAADLGYRRVDGPVPDPDQGLVSVSVRYGDPFVREVRVPFVAFRALLEIEFPSDEVLTRFEERGVLRSWDLTDRGTPARHVFAVSQEYDYVNNEAEVVGAQAFSAGILSRFALGGLYAVETDLEAVAVPLAAVQTAAVPEGAAERDYDFGSGGGLLSAVRLRRGDRELVSAGYGISWLPTVSGPSDFNTLQFFRVTGVVPVTGLLGIGGGYRWYRRETDYPDGLAARRSQSEWRVFVRVSFPG